MTFRAVAPGSRAHNLPAQPTPLLGRAREQEVVRQQLLLDEVRLLTLFGPAGVGKTRLAVAVAEELVEAFADGVRFVDLALLTDPALVPRAIAESVGVTDTGNQPLLRRLEQHLERRQMLLVLDNFEQVLPAAAHVAELLRSAPDVKMLVTSREPLHLRWERTFAVPPLPLPDLRQQLGPPLLAEIPSTALFAQRAQAVDADFALTPDNAAVVAKICVRLDGLPLAIELAAARSNVLAPDDMLARFEYGLPLLRWGAQDLPARHQTLRAAIGWSYDLLTAEEQALFRQLGVFVGGWTLDAAEAVCGPRVSGIGGAVGPVPDLRPPTPAVFDGLASLVDKSLVQVALRAEGGPRFHLLETVRRYALEQLEASGELEATRRRHAAYFLELAERGDRLSRGPEQATWLARLEREHDNLRAALACAVGDGASGGELDRFAALRLALSLVYFWRIRGHWREGRHWLTRAAERVGDAPDLLRARVLHASGVFAYGQGEYERGEACLAESLALSREIGDDLGAAMTLNSQGIVAWRRGDYGHAAALHEEALTLSRATGDPWATAYVLLDLGILVRLQHDFARAASLFEESLAGFRSVGDPHQIATSLAFLADAVAGQDRYGEAAALLAESLASCRDRGDRLASTYAVTFAAAVLGERAAPERVARLLAGADALASAIGWRPTPAEAAAAAQAGSTARARLGEGAFAAAWADGRLLDPNGVVDEALTALEQAFPAGSARVGAPPARRPSNVLSGREQEVLRLIAGGHSNRQIAETLIISEPTAKFHVASILNKLGADTRAQAVALAAQRGLLADSDDATVG